MRKLIYLAFFFMSYVEAAPFLTADPYPITAKQPETFRLFFDGSTIPVTSTAVFCDVVAVSNGTCATADNSKIMRHDLVGLSKTNHTVVAEACSTITGCSGRSSLFSFTFAVPMAPSGLRITP